MGLVHVLYPMMLTVTAIQCLKSGTTAGTTSGTLCGTDEWYPLLRTCVKIIKVPTSWTNASAICEEDGSHLLKIPDNETQMKLKGLVKGSSDIDLLWMGARRENVDSDFKWPDDTEVTFSNWKNESTSGNCGVLNRSQDWAWVTYNCTQDSMQFLCQRMSSSDGSNSIVKPLELLNNSIDYNIDNQTFYLFLVVNSSKPVENLTFFLNGQETDNSSIVDFEKMKEQKIVKDGISFVRSYSSIRLYFNIAKLDAETEVKIRMNSPVGHLDFVLPQDVIRKFHSNEESPITTVVGISVGVVVLAVIVGVIILVDQGYLRKWKQDGRKMKETKVEENKQGDGRTVTEDGLVYVTVDHASKPNSQAKENSPRKKRAEEKVEYVSVDFAKSGEKSGRTVTEDGLVYISVDVASKPKQTTQEEKPKRQEVEYTTVDFQKSGRDNEHSGKP